ncbi:MAG TPA: hypothetical protein VF407_25215, partial [Polyangiaceae bacterium]
MKRVLALVVSLCAVLALAMTAGGCEAIVSDNLPGYTCSDNAGCPAGQYCYGNAQHTGTCQTCTQTDTCDGIDNDC